MAPLALVPNLVTRWPLFHYFQIWSPDGATCISSKFDHQRAKLALVPIQAGEGTQVTESIPWVRCASGNVLSLSVSILFVSSSAGVTSVKFHTTSLSHSLVSDNQTHRSDQVYLGPIKIKCLE